MFSFLMGALLLRSAAVYVRHGRSIVLYSNARLENAIQGRVEYARWLTLRLSAWDLFSFALLYLLLFTSTSNIFFLGGALSCSVTAAQHWNMARQAKREKPLGA